MASILIVEDEVSINELLKRNLELIGHVCEHYIICCTYSNYIILCHIRLWLLPHSKPKAGLCPGFQRTSNSKDNYGNFKEKKL